MANKIYDQVKTFIKVNLKSLIIIFLVFLLFMIELPYSIYTPGGAVDLNKRIEVEDSYEVEGSFNMAYVSMVRGSIPFLLISKIIPDWDIVKTEDITIEGEDMEEMMARERLDLKESQDAAVINAYKKAGKTLEITKLVNNVVYIAEDAKTDLKVGDELLKIEGIEITDINDIHKIVEEKSIGDDLEIEVKRDDKVRKCKATIFEMEGEPKIGINITTTYEYTATPEVKLTSKASEMGSSGGLMMSLTIYNKLVETDITHGKKIVGTGTIDIDGNVGEIGGVKYKLVGAVKNKADIFMCPKENYEEAKKIAEERNYNIKIIDVGTFDEALEELAKLN